MMIVIHYTFLMDEVRVTPAEVAQTICLETGTAKHVRKGSEL